MLSVALIGQVIRKLRALKVQIERIPIDKTSAESYCTSSMKVIEALGEFNRFLDTPDLFKQSDDSPVLVASALREADVLITEIQVVIKAK